MMSTAEITEPSMPKRFFSVGSASALPCPQSQIVVARRSPLCARFLLTGCAARISRERRMRSASRSAASPGRMCGGTLARGAHETGEALRAVAGRHVRGGSLVGDIVRRRRLHFFLAGAPDHQVPVADAGKEFDAVATEFAV